MVPKVAGKGRSFKGAALYYLHDKGALTAGRVAFTHTENLPTLDADKAVKCMAWTAMHQQEIKARAGGSAKGRKLAHPVYTYSLSWAPGEEPSREEMIAAAQQTMRSLGLDGHEAIFVAHNDMPHRHIHVIVNRVHPETGIAAKLSNDHLKLSAWAESYERRQGQIRCEQRVENNARRREKEFVKDRASQKAAEYYRWQRLRVRERVQRRLDEQKNLSAAHKAQRESLRAVREHRVRGELGAIRQATQKNWHALYGGQKEQRDRLNAAQRSAWSRLRYFLHSQAKEYFRGEKADRSGFLSAGFAAVVGGPRQFAELEKKQRRERAALARKIRDREHEAVRPVDEEYTKALDKLKDIQRRQSQELGRRQSEQSQRQAKEATEGRDWEEFARQHSEKLLKETKQAGRQITRPQSDISRDFGHAAAKPPEAKKEFDRAAKPPPPVQKEFEKAAKPKRRIFRDFEQAAKPPRRIGKEFEKASRPPEKDQDRKKEGSERLRRDIADQKQDMGISKEGADKARQEGRKRTYTAFRDLANEVTRDRGRERTIKRKPPKPPENGE